MALGDQPARGVDRQAAAERRLPGADIGPTLADLAEAQHLRLINLAKAGGVMHLGNLDVARPYTRHLIGALSRDLA